jgi:ankyrin repeat protein
MAGHLEIVRLLCDHGADIETSDIETSDEDGCRPLHNAAYLGQISVVKELIEVRNAEINARDIGGWTALRIAREEAKDDIAAYLVSHGGVE